jgi:hypothetical protein
MPCLKKSILIVLVCLSGCSWFHTGWFHAKKPAAPETPQLIVTGAPAGSVLFVDGVQVRQATEAGGHAQVLEVATGTHTLEVRKGDAVTYRENFDVEAGEKRVITVLSGTG